MLSLGLSCSAYDGVAQLFAEESGDLFNSLSYSARYEMLNNFTQGKNAEVMNNFRTTESRILQLSHEHMIVATSSGKTVELKLFPISKTDTVIAVIETVATPVKDSYLSFYDMKWKQLDASQFIVMPQLEDFFLPKAPKDQCEELARQLSFAMIEMHFEGDNLVARCNLNDFYMGDDFGHYKHLVTPSVVYILQKGKFKKKK